MSSPPRGFAWLSEVSPPWKPSVLSLLQYILSSFGFFLMLVLPAPWMETSSGRVAGQAVSSLPQLGETGPAPPVCLHRGNSRTPLTSRLVFIVLPCAHAVGEATPVSDNGFLFLLWTLSLRILWFLSPDLSWLCLGFHFYLYLLSRSVL